MLMHNEIYDLWIFTQSTWCSRIKSQDYISEYCNQAAIHVCGPAVYFVLTHGDLQQREWTFCYSVV
jgi:hypothetical protein